MRFGTDILRQADALAAFTEDPPRITRRYLTPQHRQAGDFLASLMREAGMEARYDELGNVVGRYAADRPDAPVVMTGSHMDSVRNAGRYDGLFGILTAIALPNYREFIARGYRAEARAGLLQAAQWLERAATATGAYPGQATGLPAALRQVPSGTYAISYAPADVDGVTNAAHGFTVTATRQNAQQSDRCGNFTLTHSGVRATAGGTSDAADCWSR